jgi:hypothetical protein
MTSPETSPYSVSIGSASGGGNGVSEEGVAVCVAEGSGVGVVVVDGSDAVVAGVIEGAGVSTPGLAQPATRASKAMIPSMIASSFFIF